jgi:ribosome-binding protein aMBF1 (putative translation factor)
MTAMTRAIDDIVSDFAEVQGTEREKLAWLRERLAALLEELAVEIERRLVEEPTFVGKLVNNALNEAAGIVRSR